MGIRLWRACAHACHHSVNAWGNYWRQGKFQALSIFASCMGFVDSFFPADTWGTMQIFVFLFLFFSLLFFRECLGLRDLHVVFCFQRFAARGGLHGSRSVQSGRLPSKRAAARTTKINRRAFCMYFSVVFFLLILVLYGLYTTKLFCTGYYHVRAECIMSFSG